MPDNWLLYSSTSIDLYAFGAHIPFWVYFLLSQSTRCLTPLLSSLIVKKQTKKSHYYSKSLMCTRSTDLCSICFCFVSSISIILCPMMRHECQSSTPPCRNTDGLEKTWRSTVWDVMNWSVIQLIKARIEGGNYVQCSFCVLCCYTMQVVILILCTVYCNNNKKLMSE